MHARKNIGTRYDERYAAFPIVEILKSLVVNPCHTAKPATATAVPITALHIIRHCASFWTTLESTKKNAPACNHVINPIMRSYSDHTLFEPSTPLYDAMPIQTRNSANTPITAEKRGRYSLCAIASITHITNTSSVRT